MPTDHLLHCFLRGDLKGQQVCRGPLQQSDFLALTIVIKMAKQLLPLRSCGPQFLSSTGSMPEITLFCSSDDPLQVK